MTKLTRILIAASALAMTTAMPALAKTFVYCSEASPEGFDPAPYTAGTTFDASAHPIYNRLDGQFYLRIQKIVLCFHSIF